MLIKLYKALGYALSGLKAAFTSEVAFRLEVALAAILIPAAMWLGQGALQQAILISSVLLVLMIELINTAIETLVDRLSPDWHPLSKKAKDVASAAVLLAVVQMMVVWGLVVWG